MASQAEPEIPELVRINETITLLRGFKSQIVNMPADTIPIELSDSLIVICDNMIEIFRHGRDMDTQTRCNNFLKILAALIRMLELKQRDVKRFMGFINEKLGKTKKITKKGNKQQILWTAVNCAANGVGVIAVFIPGLNVPLIATAALASVAGITGQTLTKRQTNKKLEEVMNDINTNDSHYLISFSEVVETKQREYERRLQDLVDEFGFNQTQANVVVMIEMIVDCLCGMRTSPVIQPAGHPSITAENWSGITSHILTKLRVMFDMYGREIMTNIVDDVLQIGQSTTMRVASSAIVIITTAINIYQIYNDIQNREQNVEAIEQMYKALYDGKESLQFFINNAQDLRLHFYHTFQLDLESQVKVLKKSNDQAELQLGELRQETGELREELARQNERFQRLIQILSQRNINQIADLTEPTNDDVDHHENHRNAIEWN